MTKPTILDNLAEIRSIDKGDMLSFCVHASLHYEKASRLANQLKIGYSQPNAVIVAGMGGSAIGGELLKDWARPRVGVPIDVCRDYHIPAYANQKTLMIVISYSGETEETLSAFLEAYKRKCMVICISSGGTLQKFAQELSVPHLSVPTGMAPRATLPYLFIPLPTILQKIGLVSDVDVEVADTVRILMQVSSENLPERPTGNNLSKTLALKMSGTIPVVYGFGFYRAVAQRMKTQFNENSKNPAKWEFFPELNHNEIVGWEAASEFAKNFSVILVRDGEEPKEIRERIDFTKETLSQIGIRPSEVWSRGKNSLAKMSSVICVGDFASVYLAVLRGVDPTPVKTIDRLKERLKQTGTKEKTIRELQRLVKK